MNEVLINGRFLRGITTGIERFAFEMVNALDELIDEGHPLTQNFNFSLALSRKNKTPNPFRHIADIRRGYLSGHAWEQINLALFPPKDIILNLCNFGPILRSNNVTCVHDAHVWLIPNNFSSAFQFLYRALLPWSVRRSTRWVTVSEYSNIQLQRFGVADRPADAITPNGSNHVLKWNSAKSGLDVRKLPERFIFALGSQSLNKNFDLFARLAAALRPEGIFAVVAGGVNNKVFSSSGLQTSGQIVQLGRVTDDDLALVMKKAICLVFPSFFEGFGVPPIEAMCLGCPVVASSTSAMPQVLGDAAILCDPADLNQWIEAVHKLMNSLQVRNQLISRGHARAKTYTWRNSALSLLAVLHTCPRVVNA